MQETVRLIDFLQAEVMQKNWPTLLLQIWGTGSLREEETFTFGTVIGVDWPCGDPQFTVGFQEYLTEKEVDPRHIELVTIASCAGHSFVSTNGIPEGESENIGILTERSYAKYGSIYHGTHIYHDQSILRNGLDVDFGARAHFCVATNLRPLKRHGLYCYFRFAVAIRELGLKVMYSKTAQVFLVEDYVPL